MCKGLSCFKIISTKIIKYKNNFNYCWNYGPSTLLLHFIKYRPDQLNSNHTKIAVNSTIQFLKAALKEMPAKSLNFFGPLTTKWRPCKMFVKLNGKHLLMANIFKLHEYQRFALMKMHNMCKIWFDNKIFSLWKRLVFDYRAVENAIF